MENLAYNSADFDGNRHHNEMRGVRPLKGYKVNINLERQVEEQRRINNRVAKRGSLENNSFFSRVKNWLCEDVYETLVDPSSGVDMGTVVGPRWKMFFGVGEYR